MEGMNGHPSLHERSPERDRRVHPVIVTFAAVTAFLAGETFTASCAPQAPADDASMKAPNGRETDEAKETRRKTLRFVTPDGRELLADVVWIGKTAHIEIEGKKYVILDNAFLPGIRLAHSLNDADSDGDTLTIDSPHVRAVVREASTKVERLADKKDFRDEWISVEADVEPRSNEANIAMNARRFMCGDGPMSIDIGFRYDGETTSVRAPRHAVARSED